MKIYEVTCDEERWKEAKRIYRYCKRHAFLKARGYVEFRGDAAELMAIDCGIARPGEIQHFAELRKLIVATNASGTDIQIALDVDHGDICFSVIWDQ